MFFGYIFLVFFLVCLFFVFCVMVFFFLNKKFSIFDVHFNPCL